MFYNAPSGSTDPNAPYVGKNVAAGTQGSKLPPAAAEYPQRELVAIIAAGQAAGLDAPTNSDLKQVLKAVRSGLLDYSVATGTADAMIIAPAPAYTALLPGMRFRVKVPGSAASITTTPTLAISGISAPIRLRNGAAPAVGDVVNGAIIAFDIDDQGRARFVGPALSEIANTATFIQILNTKRIAGGQPFPFTVAGYSTLSVAANTTFSVGENRGAGGGGGGAASTTAPANGGGGGANARKVCTAITDAVLGITVGTPGLGGAAGGGNGTNGGTTSVVVVSGQVIDSGGTTYGAGQTLCAATGGAGGNGNTGGGAGSASQPGGVATGGDINDSGDSGGLPQGPFQGGGYLGGLGGSSPGSGGSPSANLTAAGNGSSSPGVGGNGASANAPGANGASGRVIIYK